MAALPVRAGLRSSGRRHPPWVDDSASSILRAARAKRFITQAAARELSGVLGRKEPATGAPRENRSWPTHVEAEDRAPPKGPRWPAAPTVPSPAEQNGEIWPGAVLWPAGRERCLAGQTTGGDRDSMPWPLRSPHRVGPVAGPLTIWLRRHSARPSQAA